MLNVQMYTQMGYSEALVRKAYEYSQKNRIDMFDALQQLQNKDYVENQKKLQRNVPAFSYLNNLKNIKLTDYEIVYSRSGVKENAYGRDELREPNTPVGLFNVSNCCYLNSLLQCYFLMGAFTREILSAEEMGELPQQPGTKNKRIRNQYLLLGALKQIFAKMKLSSRRYLDPTPVLKNLVNSVGQKIQFGDEKDLNEINMEIVERLSECLMYTKKYYSKDGSPSKIKKRQNIKHLFYGEKVQFIEGLEEESVVDFMGMILNPKHVDLLSALDAELNYDVQIDGKIMKKHTFIRSLPNYLFFTITRTQFEKKGNQILKNSEKLAFDFVIYLDQFLQENRQEGKLKNPKIKQLQNRKNAIKFQLNHLDLLAQKLDQCRVHAKYIAGWQQKFPKQEQVEQQKKQYKKQIQKIEQQLSQVQGRKQKYVLMYLFVHRGDAISGHYWGYGRNGNYWYRFDVNCVSIKEVDILVDMEKSGGIPYAMVYAKDGQIESFAYPYYTNVQAGGNLLDMPESSNDYSDYIPMRLKKQIIAENIAMHESIQKQKLRSTIDNVVKDYRAKFNIVKSETQKYMKGQKNGKIPSFSNFACFLQSNGETQFMKYNIFSMALASKAEMTCSELIHDEKLLKALQNAFRKKVKGKMSLRHFAIQCEPGEGTKYKQAASEYLTGKKCLEFIRLIHNGIKQWPKINNLNGILEDINEELRTAHDGIYIKSVARQIVAIMILDLAYKKQSIKLSWVDACDKQNPLLKQQLQALQAKQLSDSKQIKGSPISQMEVEQSWSLDSLKKGFENDVLSAIKDIIGKLSDGMAIYRKNTKQNKIVGKAQEEQNHQNKQEKKQEKNEQKKQEKKEENNASEDLI